MKPDDLRKKLIKAPLPLQPIFHQDRVGRFGLWKRLQAS